MSITHLFLSIVFFVLTLSPVQSKTIDQEPQIFSAYLDILKLKLESGRTKLDRIIPTQSQLGHYHFVKSLADVLEILVTEDEALYKKYDDSEEDNLRGLREMEDSDPHKRFMLPRFASIGQS